MGRVRGSVLVAALAAVLVVAGGCKKKDASPTPTDTDTLAQDGTDTAAVETDSQLLTSSLVGTSGGTITLADANGLGAGDLAGQNVGDGPKAFFFPRGCLTVTSDDVGRTAKYVFAGCSGPLGLLRVKGEVTASYQVSPNKLVLDLVATDLAVNRATVDWHAHAEIDADGTKRTMTWTAELSGVTARGREFTRTNSKTVTWTVGGSCFALSGTAEGTVKGRDIKTEISSFSRCAGTCPEAGGKITVTDVSTGTKIEITFDGTSTATVTTPSGTTPIELACAG